MFNHSSSVSHQLSRVFLLFLTQGEAIDGLIVTLFVSKDFIMLIITTKAHAKVTGPLYVNGLSYVATLLNEVVFSSQRVPISDHVFQVFYVDYSSGLCFIDSIFIINLLYILVAFDGFDN